MSKRFSWGRVIDTLELDFDGEVLSVTKFHPYMPNTTGPNRPVDEQQVLFHCEALRESWPHLDALVLSWMVSRHVGRNESSLVRGLCRALNIED